MFTTPTIPTDSLYKFLFVGGIVLMIASTYFLLQNQHLMNKRISYLDSANNNFILKSKHLDEKSEIKSAEAGSLLKSSKDNIEKGIDTLLLDKIQKGTISESDIKKLNQESKGKEKYVYEAQRLQNKAKSVLSDIKVINQNLDSLNKIQKIVLEDFNRDFNNIELQRNMLTFAMFSGLFLMVIGWLQWQYYIQTPQDKLLLFQVELAKIELQEKIKSIQIKEDSAGHNL